MSNRIIKFRAWDKEMEMIIYPKKHYAPLYKDGHIAELYNPEENEFHIVYDNDNRFELMQYTGLKDKNGKEIYEGDIIKAIDGSMANEIIVWNNAGFINFQECSGQSFSPENCEVIGNIYENKDLLK